MSACITEKPRRGVYNKLLSIYSILLKQQKMYMQHTFLYISLPLFCTTTTCNFLQL